MATCSSCGLTFTSRKQLGAHRRRCARAGNNSNNGYGDAAIAPVITTAVHAPDEAPLPSLQQIVRRNPDKEFEVRVRVRVRLSGATQIKSLEVMRHRMLTMRSAVYRPRQA